MSTSGGSGPPGTTKVATAHLNGAAIGTLFSAPTTLVAAPGAGKVIIPVVVYLEWKAGIVGFQAVMKPAGFYTSPVAGNEVTVNCSTPAIFDNSAVPVSQVSILLPSQFNAASSAPTARTVANNAPLIFGLDTADPTRAGPIVTATVAAGGTGYAVNDTGTIPPDIYAGGATYRVTAVAPVTGAVTAFVVTAAGDGYSTVDNPLPTATGGGQPGAGVNFTVNVTAITPADGDIYLTAYYNVVALH